MRKLPILFSAPMVRAILEGRKTQTRRILAPQPDDLNEGQIPRQLRVSIGDLLWVREAWAPLSALTHNDPGATALAQNGFYRADESTVDGEIDRWRPSIHMPRWASRITLRVTDVKVERLQDISGDDAQAEGIEIVGLSGLQGGDLLFKNYLSPPTRFEGGHAVDGYFDSTHPSRGRAYSFASLWKLINGPGSWEANPWVAAYSFEPIFQNIDAIKPSDGGA